MSSSIFLRVKPGLHVMFLHRFSLRFETGLMNSYGAVYTGCQNMSERSKVPLTKMGYKTLRVNKA